MCSSTISKIMHTIILHCRTSFLGVNFLIILLYLLTKNRFQFPFEKLAKSASKLAELPFKWNAFKFNSQTVVEQIILKLYAVAIQLDHKMRKTNKNYQSPVAWQVGLTIDDAQQINKYLTFYQFVTNQPVNESDTPKWLTNFFDDHGYQLSSLKINQVTNQLINNGY